ncbi:unnamed protein product [marine sediment metagenome]|uniref:Cohesin domain-containing protein n=1 Tax=marine sediment metagenome TaxID=412755 RepID=X1G5Z6_9ZZZZ
MAGNIEFAEVTIRKDVTAPIIAINNPQNSDVIGATAPNFDISIDELNLDKTWYSLNGGNNITFTGLTGTINQALWDALSEGNVIIRFYANDTLGRIGFQEVSVVKTISQPSPPGIPGYNILLLLGIVSTIAVIIVKKRLNLISVVYVKPSFSFINSNILSFFPIKKPLIFWLQNSKFCRN